MSAPSTQATLARQVVEAVQAAVGPGPVGLHEPRFVGNEWNYVKECLDSTFVSSVGTFVDRFEAELAAFTGAKHAVAVVNGTAALHVALRLAGVWPGDEVLLPALTFVATTTLWSTAARPRTSSTARSGTLGIGVQRASGVPVGRSQRSGLASAVNRITGRVIRAVVPMHTFGHPGDIDGLLALARDFHLAVVEDAAESLGSTAGGRHTGTFGLVGTLSFNGNKTITTGGGGAMLTDDAGLARRAKHLTTTAKVPHRWDYRHDEVGYNYRMPNINAALGCAQLEQLPRLVEGQRRLFHRYRAAFAGVPFARIVEEPDGCRSNYWLQALLLDEPAAGQSG